MNFNHNDWQTKFTLPNGTTTNGYQLKHLQQKLLKNHYERHTQLNKYPYQSKNVNQNQSYKNNNKSARSERNISQKDNYLQAYDTHHQSMKLKQRNHLANDLLEQINYKNMKKSMEKRLSLEQQSKMIKNINQLSSIQRQREKQFNAKYKQQAKEDMQIKQKKKQLQKRYIENQKLKEKVLIDNHANIRSQSLKQLGNMNYRNILDPTKNYVDNLGQAMKVRENIISNPEHATSSFKITNTSQKLNIRDSLDMNFLHNHYNKQQSLMHTMKSKEVKEKEDLRNTLLSQIREKQQKRNQQKQNYLIPYSTTNFRNLHHPINNPVDFKYAHDNRYIIGELKSLN